MYAIAALLRNSQSAKILLDDLDNMKVPRYRMGRHWMREYHKHFPISAPEDDYEDRIDLYEM